MEEIQSHTLRFGAKHPVKALAMEEKLEYKLYTMESYSVESRKEEIERWLDERISSASYAMCSAFLYGSFIRSTTAFNDCDLASFPSIALETKNGIVSRNSRKR